MFEEKRHASLSFSEISVFEVSHFCEYGNIAKSYLNSKNRISTHMFVNTKCNIKHEVSKFL